MSLTSVSPPANCVPLMSPTIQPPPDRFSHRSFPGGLVSRWLHPGTVLALLLCALVSFCAWAAINRPVDLPEFRGTVAGLGFSPFHRGESAEGDRWPSNEEISADLRLVAEVTGRIRTYTVQGNFSLIPHLAAHLPLKLTLGAWLDQREAANHTELVRLISATQGARNVERVLVGNEVLLRHDLTPAQLIAELQFVRKAVRVPVSTAEPWHVWLAHRELAANVDFITIHLLPYWEGLPVDDALRFVLDKLDAVHQAFPDKPILIGEVGWPSSGVEIGSAVASRVNQAAFLRRFMQEAERRHLDYFTMEAFDQPWKTSFEGRAAGYWGVMDLDRVAKWPMIGPVSEHPYWYKWAIGSVLVAAVLAWLLLSRRPDIRLPGKLLLAGLAQVFSATLAAVLLAMSGKYLSVAAGLVWGGLAVGQGVLLLLLLADSFELAETLWGRVWRRRTTPFSRLPQGLPPGARLAKVSLHLPICNEPPHMVRQTLQALAALDYPDFEVLVVDNNTLDPALWEPVAEHCARLGPRFRFFHLGRHPGFKAGALNFALRYTAPDAEVIGVLDSDYLVSTDWLASMVPFFHDPKVGFVQSPQDYRDNDGSFFKRLMYWEYAGFFHLGMVTRNERNAIIQHGTMTLIRRIAIDRPDAHGIRGWAEWTITEDAELGLRLFRQGWEAMYANHSFGRGVMPDDFSVFRKQRFRWAFGAMQICRGHWRALLWPFNHDLTLGQRWHFITGWLPWVGDAFGLLFLLTGLAWSAGLVLAPNRFEFPIVLFMLPSVGLFAFKLVQLLALYRRNVPCTLADRLGAAVAGLALSHTIGKAVWKGLLIGRAPFCRTPKLARAPALIQGLVMAGEECVLLALTWAAMFAVGFVHQMATPETRLWCLVLLTQSLPYVASVFTSIVAAAPARRRLSRKLPIASVQTGDPTAFLGGSAGD
jgi:exo-beta-1,3-glucanase (GH17 family)/cellulose synthase/poly-beta-1,6-N-acetylglucosamine synthase-like glycosyltransferase